MFIHLYNTTVKFMFLKWDKCYTIYIVLQQFKYTFFLYIHPHLNKIHIRRISYLWNGIRVFEPEKVKLANLCKQKKIQIGEFRKLLSNIKGYKKSKGKYETDELKQHSVYSRFTKT